MLSADACLLASIEIAKQISPSVDYMVASSELVLGEGWIYKDLIRRPNRIFDISSGNVSREAVKSYLKGYHSSNGIQLSDLDLSMSAIDLNEVKLPAAKFYYVSIKSRYH